MKHGSLFSGIGGFDLAAQWCGWQNIFQVEIDNFCQKVLAKNFPDVKRYKDIKEFDGTEYKGSIDIISGGFPCQPFSVAGKQRGKADDRWLWDEMLRVIKEIQPCWIVGENGANLWNMGIENMLSQVEDEGYEVESFIIPACAKKMLHRRDRIWIIAHSKSNDGNNTCLQNSRNKTFGLESGGCFGYESMPKLCRVDDGIPTELDRLKSLGNAIVPQVVFEIFNAIDQIEQSKLRLF